MGGWKLAAVALTRSRLEESLDYGGMTQRCRLLYRLPLSWLLLPTAATATNSSTAIDHCMFFALHKSRSKVKCVIVIELSCPFTRARQGVYTKGGFIVNMNECPCTFTCCIRRSNSCYPAPTSVCSGEPGVRPEEEGHLQEVTLPSGSPYAGMQTSGSNFQVWRGRRWWAIDSNLWLL